MVTQKVPTTYHYNLHTLCIPFAAHLFQFKWVTFYFKILEVLQTFWCIFSDENQIWHAAYL